MYLFEGNLLKVVLTLCEDAGTPRALTVSTLIRHGEYGQLFDLKVDPAHYLEHQTQKLRYDIAVTEILRKSDPPLDLPKGSEDPRKRAAEDRFFATERECYKTNQRLWHVLDKNPDVDQRVIEFFGDLKRSVSEILGPLPRDLVPKFGPGATFDDKGKLQTIPDKMTSRPTVTASATWLMCYVEQSAWYRAKRLVGNPSCHPKIVRGNRFVSVPKDANKLRGICVGPSINGALQLAVGSFMKKRLYTWGQDLYNGQARQQRLARQGSRDGAWATIDLSDASDLLAKVLVKLALPDLWHELLVTLREPSTLIRGRWAYLEKFSAMGNGYTFELLTTILTALCVACGVRRGEVFIYGDDIIVPTDKVSSVLAALKYCGFTPNKRKTFTDGCFRESCGGDFFNGAPVRGHYIKDLPNEPQDWISLANGLRRLGEIEVGNPNPDEACSVDFRYSFAFRAWLRCCDNIPRDVRVCVGPPSLGDLVIHDDRIFWTIIRRARTPYVKYVRVYRPIAKTLQWCHWWPEIQLAACLYGVPSQGPLPRDNVTGYKRGYAVVF